MPTARKKKTKRASDPLRPVRQTGDARRLKIDDSSVDLCLTSPPYWKKRKYGHPNEIGHERTREAYGESMRAVLREIRRILKPTGSAFVNIGDTYHGRSLAGIPHLVEEIARQDGWRIRNRIIWAKPNGLPSPHADRLTNRHEIILHLTGPASYFYDVDSLCEYKGSRFPGGDVWEIPAGRVFGKHPAAFPPELAGRVIALACPRHVCRNCGFPRERITKREKDLDLGRPQARRALELFAEKGLTLNHLAAIRAVGISDAGKGRRLQAGARRNTKSVLRLAKEAKAALGGYFREFTFAKRVTAGYTKCRCSKGWEPGLVVDVFAGTGTTLTAARKMRRRSIGVDLLPWKADGTLPKSRAKQAARKKRPAPRRGR
jgi:DNA modification methylase